MKTPEDVIVLLLLLVFARTSKFCNAVLTGYEHQDITADVRFGCSWQGGISSAVTCHCRDDAEEMYITENSISSYDTSTISIIKCQKVSFGPKSIQAMQNLRNIYLSNITSLKFDQTSLRWYGYQLQNRYEERYDLSVPSLRISIENSNVSLISSYTFEGRINTIEFNGVNVEQMDPFAFTSLIQTRSILLKNTHLRNVKLQSFKKFSTENLEFDGVSADIVPSRFISNVTVYDKFLVKNCRFDVVRPGAFLVQNPSRFHVTDTRINVLNGEAFKVTARGDVLFKNNTFDVINDGAFRGITLYKDEAYAQDATIHFDSNVFTELTRDSLSVHDDFTPKFSHMNINESCDCKRIDHQIKATSFYGDIKCLHNGDFVTVKEFKANMCSLIASYSITIVIVVVVVTLCIIIVSVLVFYYRRVYLSKKYGSEKTSKNGGKGNISLIVPDGRTYRETELHVIVERADLLTTDL